MKKIITAFALLLSLHINAQQKTTATKYAKTITPAGLKKKLTIIAGPQMEGRETATAGQRKAAAYIEGYFKKLGLQPGMPSGYQMQYPLFQDSLLYSSLSINGDSTTLYKDFEVNLSPAVNGTWEIRKVIFAFYGLATTSINDFDGLDVKDKWLMVIDSLARESDLKAKGIKGLIIVTRDFPVSKPIKKGRMFIDTGNLPANVPVVYVSGDIALKILSSANVYQSVRGVYNTSIHLDIKKQVLNLQSSNILGILPGTEKKDEYVFITAHYDHLGRRGNVIYYGADDDGSGTTSILEIAEAFAKAKAEGKAPKRTIVFMTVSGEEKGLLGSEYYTTHPVFPLSKTSVDLNIDMVGRIDPQYKGDSNNYVYVIGDDKLSSDLKKITDSINNQYTHLQLDRRYNDANDPNRFYYRSDHYNFAKNNVPIIFYFNGTHADYHKPTDTVDKINFSLMAKRVTLVFYTAWEMANREDMLSRDIPLN